MAELSRPAKGTRPEGAQTESGRFAKSRAMFTEIAPRYEFPESFAIPAAGSRVGALALRAAPGGANHAAAGARVLDLCCGTGDLAFALARSGPAYVVGADFSHAMLVRANAKRRAIVDHEFRFDRTGRFFEADALAAPLCDASFDLVTTAFGFRNLAIMKTDCGEIRVC